MSSNAPAINTAGVRKQPMNRTQLNHIFEDRYPALSDLLSHGGIPGVAYALLHASSVGQFQSRGWDLVARLPVLIVRVANGPKAGDHPAMLACNGRAIPGAPVQAGVRSYHIDEALDEATGLGPAPTAERKPPAPPAPKERTAS